MAAHFQDDNEHENALGDTSFEANQGQHSNENSEGENNNDYENSSDDEGSLYGLDEEQKAIVKRFSAVEKFIRAKHEGSLGMTLIGPTNNVYSQVTASVSRGSRYDPEWVTPLDDPDRGFVQATHEVFELYKRKKKYIKQRGSSHLYHDEEQWLYFDCEADPYYENTVPGTVTGEGYASECWEYLEDSQTWLSGDATVLMSELPNPRGSQLLRRLDELRRADVELGTNPEQDSLDLIEFIGDNAVRSVTFGRKPLDERDAVDVLYGVLNRRDVFMDFTTLCDIGPQWLSEGSEMCIGVWNFIWQVILTTELARRLEKGHGLHSGFTAQILASLIVSELWLKNVQLVLVDAPVDLLGGVKEPVWRQMAKARDVAKRADEAIKASSTEEASELYEEVLREASGWKQLAPNDAKAWELIGKAWQGLDNTKQAIASYTRAVELAPPNEKDTYQNQLTDAELAYSVERNLAGMIDDPIKRDTLEKKLRDQDWALLGTNCEGHSIVHKRQEEGLLAFAEAIRWPYIDEVRERIHEIYPSLRNGATIPASLHDWLFGVMLPGKWFAYTVMNALVACSPESARPEFGQSSFYFGLILPGVSYWRSRTAIGRVLGAYPGVVALNGWIGPCPEVRVYLDWDNTGPRWIRVTSDAIAPDIQSQRFDNDSEDEDEFGPGSMQPTEDDNIDSYENEIQDPDAWSTLSPPQVQIQNQNQAQQPPDPIELSHIRVRAEPLEGAQLMTDAQRASETRYTAEIAFSMNGYIVTFPLRTTPAFITPPRCYPPEKADAHQVHRREAERYQTRVWTAHELQDRRAQDVSALETIVICVTEGIEEVVARAWCAREGVSAVVRRVGGPCYRCTLGAAGMRGLRVGVLIWVES
ncbi:hypothetical protein BJX68DRAFT_267574 [Aspergillus pseudodeflectus]|uniref:Uncharacterized protein n=1 Tax=Aspergillus pseudodeflectus TaxID=176178 RepID=A0ABR4K8V7_9EURO